MEKLKRSSPSHGHRSLSPCHIDTKTHEVGREREREKKSKKKSGGGPPPPPPPPPSLSPPPPPCAKVNFIGAIESPGLGLYDDGRIEKKFEFFLWFLMRNFFILSGTNQKWYIYIYIYICVCVCVCIYIYIAPRVASYRAKRKKIIIYITHTTHITDVTDISDITHVTSLDPSWLELLAAGTETRSLYVQ